MIFHKQRAFRLLGTIGALWEDRTGPFSGIVPPHLRFMPEGLRGDEQRLANWFFFLALPMRGPVNSDDVMRLMVSLYEAHPNFFDPQIAKGLEREVILDGIQKAVATFYPNGDGQNENGDPEGGALSLTLDEIAGSWIHNAMVLCDRWGGDVRNIFSFWGSPSFEGYFLRVDHKSGKGLVGMRRKIFTLLVLWLQETGLIHQFPTPIVVDFHALRVLLEQGIVDFSLKPLGEGYSSDLAKRRPPEMRNYPTVRVQEWMINDIISWSEVFLAKRGLSAINLSYALWYLSRLYCAQYYGNSSITTNIGGGRKIVSSLVDAKQLPKASAWPRNYVDPCKQCPVEATCRIAVPAGPYYDWGVLVVAGRHVVYPGRQSPLPGFVPPTIRSPKHR